MDVTFSPALRVYAEMWEIAGRRRAADAQFSQALTHIRSGTPDAMAYRKLNKMFYDRGADSKGHKLGYMLLFGNGTYDNRQLSSTVKAASYPMLLTWQSEASNDENTSFTSDDP